MIVLVLVTICYNTNDYSTKKVYHKNLICDIFLLKAVNFVKENKVFNIVNLNIASYIASIGSFSSNFIELN